MGNGMIYQDCSCQYEDEVEINTPEDKPISINRRTKAYREAIAKIMDISKVSKVEAEKIFEEEFYKIA
jgi:hypothetical protein